MVYARIRSGADEVYATVATLQKKIEVVMDPRDGFRELVNDNDKPKIADGKKLVYRVFIGDDGKLHKAYSTADAKDRIGEMPRKFSKLSIYGAIVSLPEHNGVAAWDQVKAWLESKTINGINGLMAFQLAQEISDDHPLFAPLAAEAKTLLGLTDEHFEAMLEACILTE